jgi:hypothetical protein
VTEIVDAANYRWRSFAFRAWVRKHGVNMDDVVRIDTNGYTQTMKVYECVRSAEGYVLTNPKTMIAASTVREIKLLSPMPN